MTHRKLDAGRREKPLAALAEVLVWTEEGVVKHEQRERQMAEPGAGRGAVAQARAAQQRGEAMPA
jgi:hypothetical protein